jgi:hypothetical protein
MLKHNEASAVGRIGFPICLNKNLDDLVAGMDFDADGSILEIYMVPTTIFASYNCISRKHAVRTAG